MMISRLLKLARVTSHRHCIREAPCYFKRFEKHYGTIIKLKVDSQNVVSSGLSNVTGFENVYLHDNIWENSARWSNKVALVCAVTGRSYTYDQLKKASSRLATSLRKSNLLPGDTIAIVLPNIPEYAIIVLAASEAGLKTTFINPVYTTYEIKRHLENSDTQAIFTFPEKYADIQASIEKNSKIKLPIIVVSDGSDTASMSGIIKLEDLTRDDIEDFSVSQKTGVTYEDTVLLPYSSGTTGLPKGVELSHRNIVANLYQLAKKEICVPEETTENYQEVLPLILPLYHMYGLGLSMFFGLRIGMKLVCMPQFSANALIKLLEEYQPTIMHVVPPIVQLMIHNERILPRFFERMKLIVSGAAPLGEESIALFQKRISNTVIFGQGYGSTEMSPVVSINVDGPLASCGHLVSNTQMRIVKKDDDNRDKNMGPGEVGEIYLRGPQLMKGYYNNPEATADSIEDGWYKSGDLGYYTEDGFLFVQGRLKELIKVKGLQVAPAELEEVIRAHDKIQDVGVIGVPHDKFGEIPKAYVVPKPGVTIDEDELKQFVAKRVANYKHLGHVKVIENIPKSAAGKILRRELAKL